MLWFTNLMLPLNDESSVCLSLLSTNKLRAELSCLRALVLYDPDTDAKVSATVSAYDFGAIILQQRVVEDS